MRFSLLTQRKSLHTLYVIAFLLALYTALPTYINSTFLGEQVGGVFVGAIYTVGSILTILLLLAMPRVLRAIGNFSTTLTLIVLQVISVLGLALAPSPKVIVLSFLVYLIINTLLWFTVDLLLESFTDNSHTGGIRGLYFSIANIAWVVAPTLAGFILTITGYSTLYLATALLLAPIAFIVTFAFREYQDPHYDSTPILGTLNTIWVRKDIYRVAMVSFLLRSFYAVMVIYTPIYLHQHIGLSWGVIGGIFTVMLVPFVLLEYPLGRIADGKLGEKELMAAGFIIIAVTTGALSFITSTSFVLWAIFLFATRIGAATIEIMSETYLFKKINEEDSHILRFFRMTNPLAYVVAPLIVSGVLAFLDIRYLFLLLGTVMLLGLWYSLKLKDTL
ncbi:MFS transporter [Candidatus Wolfebacteria bacterium]|nr:MFS transporter [Candidatus Wolfebacteria bacterium]